MNKYEKLYNLMNQHQQKTTIIANRGIMLDPTTCKVGNLILEKEDLLFSYEVAGSGKSTLVKGDEVLTTRINEDLYYIHGKVVTL